MSVFTIYILLYSCILYTFPTPARNAISPLRRTPVRHRDECTKQVVAKPRKPERVNFEWKSGIPTLCEMSRTHAYVRTYAHTRTLRTFTHTHTHTHSMIWIKCNQTFLNKWRRLLESIDTKYTVKKKKKKCRIKLNMQKIQTYSGFYVGFIVLMI